ncbi:MAG: V-type ATPase subunit [Candidatus Geothermarchaeales archaeon]
MGAITNLMTPYTSVRGFITLSMLLKREQIEQLASTRSTREMWDILKDTLMGSYLSVDAPSDEQAFQTEMISLLHTQFSSFSRVLGREKRKYLSLFLLEVEIDILKSVIHQWVEGGQVGEEMSIPGSSLFTREVMNRATSAQHPTSFQEALPLPGWTIEGLARLLIESAGMPPPLRMTRVSWSLDSRYYQYLWKTARKFASERASLGKVLGVRIDLTNLERIIRGRVLGFSTHEMKENLIDISYGVSREELSQATEAETLEAVRSTLETSPYGDLVERGVSSFLEVGKLEAVSAVFKRFEVENLKKLILMDPVPLTAVSNFSMAMLAALLRLGIIQMRVLERIFRARISGLDEEQTLSLVTFFDL